MASLLVISSAPAAAVAGQLFLDAKFVAGMQLYTELWDGPVSCLLRAKADAAPFGALYDPAQLPFAVTLLSGDRRVGPEDIRGHDLVLCSGDSHEYLHLAQVSRLVGTSLVFIIEYSPESRRQVIALDRTRSLPRKAYSLGWTLRQEARRRRAFRLADGIQANGYPALATYRGMNPNMLMYHDSRVGEGLLATAGEMVARRQRLMRGAPLRLLHSGRLEPLKGSQDLVPIARGLAERGVDFTLDIFGSGSLEEEIRTGIRRHGLQDRVRLRGVAEFETGLVPFARTQADIQLCCHRQSDPSCTYLEAMGCGLAVAGYRNRMWSSLSRASGAGWCVPMGEADALADSIAAFAEDRRGLATCSQAARRFAGRHTFEHEFRRRIHHLRALL